MSYIGSSAAVVPVAFSGVNSESFNGDGSTVAFTLNRPVSSVAAIEVVVNNVQQSPYDGSYSVNDTTLTFSAAPSTGTGNIYVVYRDFPVGSITDPNTYTKTQADTLLAGRVAKAGDTMTGNLIVNANVGVGTSSPLAFTKLEVKGTAGTQTGANQQLVVSAPSATVGEGAGIRLNAAGAVGSAKEAVAILGVVNESSGNNGAMTFHVYDGGGNIPERMRIDSAGRVTMPYQPAFKAHRTPAAWETYSVQTVILNNTSLNIGNHFNTTNGTFTAPIDGLYYFHFTAYQLQANSSGSAYIYVNGASANIYNYSITQENAALDMTNHVIVIEPLLAGDSVTAVVSGDLYTGHSGFSGYLIG